MGLRWACVGQEVAYAEEEAAYAVEEVASAACELAETDWKKTTDEETSG